VTAADRLKAIGACGEAVVFARAFKDQQVAWDACDRADWMIWLLGRLAGPPESEGRRALVLCAADCAETALPYVRDEETAAISLACIQTCRAWAHGEASAEELREARDAAGAYGAYDAAADAAAYAADAAADAAAYAAYAAADAAAYAAAYAAAADAARMKALAAMADIVRAHYPICPVLP